MLCSLVSKKASLREVFEKIWFFGQKLPVSLGLFILICTFEHQSESSIIIYHNFFLFLHYIFSLCDIVTLYHTQQILLTHTTCVLSVYDCINTTRKGSDITKNYSFRSNRTCIKILIRKIDSHRSRKDVTTDVTNTAETDFSGVKTILYRNVCTLI